ncbi:MAG: SurA N-terminal domain-containing protein [Clostridia bacterium]|nr:SurA N-terminal domain-containing protein [Clostridia bacterium]
MTLKFKAARVVSVAMALLLLTLCLAGCSGKIKPVESTEQEMRVVGTCDGYSIYYEELRFVASTYKKMLENKYGEGIWEDAAKTEKHRGELEELVLENLKANYAILTGCQNLFVKTEDKEIDDYVQEQIENLVNQSEDQGGFGGDFDAYLAWLAENDLTDHYLRFIYRTGYLESAMYYAAIEAELFAYSEKNYSDFLDYVLEGVDYARTIHVYIPIEDQSKTDEYFDTARRIADELAACTDDDERYSLMCSHIGSAVNKDLSITEAGYYFTHNEMGEEYEAAAFALSEYETSGVVEYGGGYYVIMRMPIEELYVLMYGEQLLQYYQSAQIGLYEDGIKENMKVELNEYGLSLDLVNLD